MEVKNSENDPVHIHTASDYAREALGRFGKVSTLVDDNQFVISVRHPGTLTRYSVWLRLDLAPGGGMSLAWIDAQLLNGAIYLLTHKMENLRVKEAVIHASKSGTFQTQSESLTNPAGPSGPVFTPTMPQRNSP